MAEPSDPWRFFLRLNPILTGESSPADMMRDALDAFHEMPEIAASWIGHVDQHGVIIPQAWRGPGALMLSDIAPLPDAPCRRAARSGQPQYIDEWRANPVTASLPNHEAHPDWRSGIAIPLAEPAGAAARFVLVLQSHRPGFFTRVWPPDIVAHLAAILGGGLRARLERQSLGRAKNLYQTLFKGADLLLKARSERRLTEQFCNLLVESGLFVSAAIGRPGPGGSWEHRAVAGNPAAMQVRDLIKFLTNPADRASLTMRAWEAETTMVANNYLTDTRFAPLHAAAATANFAAAVVLIICRAGRRWGTLSVSANETGFFDTEIVGMLEQLAGMLGHALNEFDLKAKLRAEREAQSRIARQDSLTSLPNRLAFHEHLEAALKRAAQANSFMAVMSIDLNELKQVNDLWGRPAGDAVLRAIARRLRACLPETDFVARLRGDEFAVILEDRRSTQDLAALCARLAEALGAPLPLRNGEPLHISFTAGLTLYPRDTGNAELLLHHAEIAMYAAKAGRARGAPFWCLYQDIAPPTNQPDRGRALLTAGALRVHYQPIMDVSTGRIVSAEALARLEDGGNLLPPAKFLHELTLDDRETLFRQVLEAALNQLRVWDADGFDLTVSVNVDAQILMLDRTLPYLRETLARLGVPPARLVLEILETHDLLDLRKAKRHTDAVRATGIRLALDDLGAGYSSILKIRELQLDVVKLDRAFVAGLCQQPDDLMFVAVFQTLTASRGMSLIVEGVETENVMDALRMMGVRKAQGFLISEPLAGPDMTQWLRGFRPAAAATEPKTILGAYAVHLSWLRVFNAARSKAGILRFLRTVDIFSLDNFIDAHGLRQTPLGDAYETLQAVLKIESVDRHLIADAAAHFRTKLKAALKAEG